MNNKLLGLCGALVFALSPSVSFALEYTFTQVSYSGWERIFLSGINDSGKISGSAVKEGEPASFTHGLLTEVSNLGSFTQIDYPSSLYGTTLRDINSGGDTIGGITRNSFVRSDTGVFTDFSVADNETSGRAINDDGNIAGFFVETDPWIASGFLATDTSFSDWIRLDVPGSDNYTIPLGLNNLDQVVGEFHKPGSIADLGFFYDSLNYFEIAVLGAREVSPKDINEAGDIVGAFGAHDINIGHGYGFLYTGGDFFEVMYPDSVATWLYGLDSLGRLVGSYSIYEDEQINTYGFLAEPTAAGQQGIELTQIEGSINRIPEPTTLALMGLGLAGIGYRRHRKIAA